LSRIVYLDEMTQCSVHPPSVFMAMHQHEILPSWKKPVETVVIVLQKCPVSLAQYSPQTQRCKNELRDRFFHIGWHLVHTLDSPSDRWEIFDPRSGFPVRSPHGSLCLDDVAIACNSLDYEFRRQGTCATLIHPTWGDAVYPATLVSTASLDTARQCLTQHMPQLINRQLVRV